MRIVEIVSPEEQPAQSQVQLNPQALDSLANLWTQFSRENPRIKLALDLLPPTALATSAMDTASQLRQQDLGSAAISALGLVPGVRPLLKLQQMGLTAQQLQRHHNLVRATDRVQNIDRAVDAGEFAQKRLSSN